MDFFQAQDRARRQTHVLVGLFAAAVLSIVVAVYLVVVVGGGMYAGVTAGFDPLLFGGVALGTGMLIGFGSLFRTSQLRKGGEAVAELLGGRPVAPDTRDPAERRLVNVVEEVAIASGTPVPAIYLLENEEGINAFAAGWGIHDAAVAFTHGALEKLDRDELQGVVAHEFSHILNGDMRLNIRLMGLLFGILLIAIVGRGLLRGQLVSRRRRDQRGALLGVALVVLGYIGVFFGKLIKAAVSRQREYLADAAAVQFTRNPQGIAGALRKIGAHAQGGRIRDHHAEELSHLFFANGLGNAFSRATATHPPLAERIRRVDPAWDGSFELPAEPPRPSGEREAEESPAPGRTGGEGVAGELGGLVAAAVLAGVGTPGREHLEHARRLRESIPVALREAAHDPDGAPALVLALLGGDDPASEEARAEVARELDAGGELAERVRALRDELGGMPAGARLPLLDLALPALHALPEDAVPSFRAGVERIIRADGTLRTFDFALVHVLWRHLPGGGGRTDGGGRRERALAALRADVEVVLTAIARAGSEDEGGARRAFDAAATATGLSELIFRPAPELDLARVDDALVRLEGLSMEGRRELLRACATAVLHDERVRPEEAELLRAIAESLELPLPPLLPGAPSSAPAA